MMTDLTLAKETRLFLLSIVVGVGLSLLYDLLRVLRLQTRHRPIVVSLEDLFYFLVCAAVTFGFALKDNSGQIRGYILIGELLGWGCWHLTAGELAVKIASGAGGGARCPFSVLLPLEARTKNSGPFVEADETFFKKSYPNPEI